ncbi:dienelactone hydrolase family protein [Phenylobacterium sp.]|uniref:dienelactone hydrolase family protein n=1 Tax=Phenylobacterium sp. TaxID=1871053 RepID=UPI002ED9AABD
MSDANLVQIPPIGLGAELRVPAAARAIVIFAHGSGSSRFSPRNRAVAAGLVHAGFATLLLDLLTEEEAASRANVFDIDLLASRLVDAIEWAREQPGTAGLAVALFGASTGAAAAIKAAALRPEAVRAVVSRGGRADLAGASLDRLTAPTLLIVGGDDEPVIDLNRQAIARMKGPAELVIVPGATHLFEEPGALERVIDLAIAWLDQHTVEASAGTADGGP